MTARWRRVGLAFEPVHPPPLCYRGKAAPRCCYCGHPMVGPSTAEHYKPHHARLRTRQHIIPRRYNGETCPENLRGCCTECNQSLAAVDDCPGALAALRAVMPDRKAVPELKSWTRRVRWLLWAARAVTAGLPVNVPVSVLIRR